MKKLPFLFSICFLYAISSVGQNDFTSDPVLHETFTLDAVGMLDVQLAGSSVQVEGTDGNEVIVMLYAVRNGESLDPTDSEVQQRLDNYNLDVSQNGNSVKVHMESKRNLSWGKNNIHFAFYIEVPREIATQFNTSGGSLSLTAVDGDHIFNTSGGSIQLEDSQGSLQAKSAGGSFRITDYSGDIDLNSSGGSIRVLGMSGTLEINSSGGSVTLEEVSGRVNANTSGGSIRADILDIDGELSLKSSGGSIAAVIPKDLPMDLDLHGGNVNTKVSNFEGEMKRDKIVGKVNGGGVLVTLASSGGSVKLDYR